MSTFDQAANDVSSVLSSLSDTHTHANTSSIRGDVDVQEIELHEHQLYGISWMLDRWKAKRNVIVADEMGLGKTLQTLGFIKLLLARGLSKGPFLVIAPLSVAPQWPKQCSDFLPSLRASHLWGTAQERDKIIDTFMTSANRPFDILVSTYESVISEIGFVSQIRWAVIVFDEGHRLKNDASVTHTVFRERLRGDFEVILTGTPVQNNFDEFWALMRFLYPGIFTESTRPVKVGTKIALPAKPTLDALIATVMLRRLFKDIGQIELPACTHYVIRTEMTKIQTDLYKWALFHYAKSLETEKDIGVAASPAPPAGVLSNLMMTLRKIASHPYLIPGVEPEPFCEGPHIWRNSNKFIVLKLLLVKMVAEDARCLIFSTFTTLLDICQDFLDFEKIPYERLDGSVRGEDRVSAISRFERGGKNPSASRIFLLSTRAGGVGLNLCSANWVIFLDSDWNPQMDLQAIARAHRQGQQKEVKVFRIVTTKSIDELIFLRTIEKLQLARTVLSEENLTEEKMITHPKEMKKMIAYGLEDAPASGSLPKAGDGGSDPLPPDVESLIESVCLDPKEQHEELVVGYKQFEGVDYGNKHRSEKELRVLDEIIDRSKQYVQPAKPSAPSVVSSSEKIRMQKLTEENRAKRKLDKWAEMNYATKSVPLVSVTDQTCQLLMEATLDQQGELRHVRGSVAEPIPQKETEASVVIHVVDSSGVWPTNSHLFMALAKKFPNGPKQYHQAKEALDLHLGDVHLVEQDNPSSTPSSASSYLALCVCHRGGRDGMDYAIFKKCLNSISVFFRKKQVPTTFHFSRIGNEAGTLYMTERIIKLYCCAYGFNGYMYYYKSRG